MGFGRRHIHAPAQELVDDMLYQLGALREIARAQGVPLQHIKPHGALYMHLARDGAAHGTGVAGVEAGGNVG